MLIDSSASARCSPHFEMLPIVISRYRACSLSMRSQLGLSPIALVGELFPVGVMTRTSLKNRDPRTFQTPRPMLHRRDSGVTYCLERHNTNQSREPRRPTERPRSQWSDKQINSPIQLEPCFQPIDPCCRDPVRERHFLGLLANHDQEHKSEHNAP